MLSGKLQAGSSSSGTAPGGWDLSNVVYQGGPINSLYLGSASGVVFSPSGTKMMLLDGGQTAEEFYSGSTAWDVYTLNSINSKSIGNATSGYQLQAAAFHSSGSYLYATSRDTSSVSSWSLSYTYSLNGLVSYQNSFSVASQDADPYGLFFKPDGTKMFVVGNVTSTVYEYALSTAWNVSTASLTTSYSLPWTSATSISSGLFFDSSGTKMFVAATSNGDIHKFTLSTAWDISTASPSQSSSVGSQLSSPRTVFFKTDGTVMYVAGNTYLYQYQLSSAWDLSTASYTGPSLDYHFISSTSPFNLTEDIFFRSNGVKMFACYGTLVRAYTLSSPWDIDTLSYDTEVSVSAQVVSAQGLAFSSDGTKMYVLSYSSSPLVSKILQYSLTTAWDITTASYVKQMLLTAYDSKCTGGMSFSPDGTKLYVVGNTNKDIHQFTLSTAWDIGSTSYVGYKDLTSFVDFEAIYFRPNGKSLYLVERSAIEQYNLSVAWDISTMPFYATRQFDTGHEIQSPQALFFKSDGSKMYASSNAIYSYDFV